MKLSLQILDAGETFFHPLGDEPCVIGSAPDAGLRLRDAGIDPAHARIEKDPAGGHRLVDLGSQTGTRVNGRDVLQARLAIGDRIEIGTAVLVVGQQVARKATPADVLADGLALARGQAELRGRAMREAEAPKRRGVAALVAVLALGLCAAIFFATRTGDGLPFGWAETMRLRRVGDFDGVRATLDRYRGTWAGEDPARRARLEQVEADLRAIEDAVAAGRIALRAEAPLKSFAQQLDELRARRQRDEDSIDGIAARVLSTELHALREGITTVISTPGPEGDAEQVRPTAPDAEGATAKTHGAPVPAPVIEPVKPAPVTPSPVTSLPEEHLAALARLIQLGRYAEGLELSRIVLESASGPAAAALRDAEQRLLAAARSELPAIVARIDALAATPADSNAPLAALDAALAALRVERARFPALSDFAVLGERARALELRREAVAGGAPAGGPSLLDLRERLNDARSAERQGEYARAASIVREVATALAPSDESHAHTLRGRAADLERLAGLVDWLAAELAAQREVALVGNEGESLELHAADGRLRVGDEPFRLDDVKPAALAALLRSHAAPVDQLLAGAVASYRAGERELAESLLVDAQKRDASCQPQIDGVIARGRGELEDSGYRLVDGAFVAAREVEARRRAVELGPVVVRIAHQPAARRDAELETLLKKGPRELDAVVLALRGAVVETAARIERDPFRKHWDALALGRRKLDEARSFAKQLIFDETRYFYPYKPPAVSAERASEYWKVQGEVDERVAALRAQWSGGPAGKRAPKKLLDELSAFDWLVATLTGFGERVADAEDRVSWARSLPKDAVLDLRSFAWDQAERATLDERDRILDYVRKRSAWMSRAERDIVDMTNEYRVLYGHRPLAVNEKLQKAARAHAKEMAGLGYFSHFSPIPEHKTPFDRMRLVGYAMGASENIANYPSSPAAFDGWLHSSGHHRNILQPGHRELGAGNDASLWVQNFGGDDEYLADPEFIGLR